MSQVRYAAHHLPSLSLPGMDDRRWNVRPCIDVRPNMRELVLLVERAMHVPGDDGIPVLSMVSMMNIIEVMPAMSYANISKS
jgi:hypothetical protein